MTDERKKFLASISKEEWIIRLNIIGLKARIRDEKFWLNHVTGDTKKQIEQSLWRINSTKIIIKNLKKQLPAPRHEQYDYISDSSWLDCSCGKGVYPTQPYCMWCGQKLR